MIEFNERLERCDGCERAWFLANGLSSWYRKFNRWVSVGECSYQREGIKPFDKVVEPEVFMPCLEEFFDTDQGSGQERNLLFSQEEGQLERRIVGQKFVSQTK